MPTSWPNVHANAGDHFADLLAAKGPAFHARTGLRILDEVIGCGGEGCVIATNDDRWVVKIISSRYSEHSDIVGVEAVVAAYLLDLQNTPAILRLGGVVLIHSVFEVSVGHNNVYGIIVKERVEPLASNDDSRQNLVEYSEAAYSYNGDWPVETSRSIIKRAKTRVVDAAMGLRRFYPELSDTLEYLATEHDLVFADVYAGNIGKTLYSFPEYSRQKGVDVLFDFGFASSVPASVDLLGVSLGGSREGLIEAERVVESRGRVAYRLWKLAYEKARESFGVREAIKIANKTLR